MTLPMALGPLWHGRWLLFKSTLAGLILGTVVALTIPKEYKSTVQLMPPDSQADFMAGLKAAAGGVSLQASAASSLLGLRTPNAAFVGVLGSRTAQDEIIDRFDLRHVYGLDGYWAARKKLTARTTIDEDKRTGNLSITVEDTDPRRAHDMAAAYVDELNKLTEQMNTSSARRERIFLEGRLKSVKDDLDAASRELSQFSSSNTTLDMQGEGRTMLESAAKLQEELVSRESELRGLQATYGEGNMRVVSAEARVGELRTQLRKLTGTENENSAPLESGQLYPSVRKLPFLGATYAELYRRVMLQGSIYEILTKQYEIAKVQEAREIPTVKVLDPPDYPEKKSFPPRLPIMLLGAMVFFMATMVWILAHAWFESAGAEPVREAARRTAREMAQDLRSGTRIFRRNSTAK
jgi:uncharacterized protein involved in exopolysaccharide biosynthesis